MVYKLRKVRRRRDRMKRAIATRIHALLDKEVMGKNDVQARERVADVKQNEHELFRLDVVSYVASSIFNSRALKSP